MSVQAIRWAFSQTVGSPTGKAVLAVLAEAADEHGGTFISHQTIAERAELGRRVVVTHMARLEEGGFIRRTRRGGPFGQRTSDAIHLGLETSLSAPDALRPAVHEVQLGPPKVHDVHSHKVHVDVSLSAPHDAPKCTTCTGTVSYPSSNQGTVRSKVKAEPPEAVSALRNQLWELTPPASRTRSSRADLARAVDAALKRGGEPEAIRSGVLAYFASPDARKDGGKFARGVHRIVENDRWASFTPAVATPPGEATPAQLWRPRVKGFTASQFWNTTDWGPKPGKPGCTAPPAILAEFGLIAGVTPIRSGAAL